MAINNLIFLNLPAFKNYHSKRISNILQRIPVSFVASPF
ncbi:hypothetical protein ADICYQ_0569 [Cyclobacterium qasimii M12-11B]|uniref:Uncharacterized protein n=1 Tax=Cyclobacterium qasimii M12-11B TaxID=641524 RepID=S7WWL2_9BACT|nr:hypothetical protein ADICYQ_0569 [Cyclobacterium qasimii M12-11B]